MEDYGENERTRALAKFLKKISFQLVKKLDSIVNKSRKGDQIFWGVSFSTNFIFPTTSNSCFLI